MQQIAAVATTPRTSAPTARVNAFTYVDENTEPVRLSANDLASTKDAVLRTAVRNASHVMEFLHSTFGRDGVDAHGQKLDVVVHVTEPSSWGAGDAEGVHGSHEAHRHVRRPNSAPAQAREGARVVEPPMNNAFWDSQSQRMYLGDGDGVEFAPLGGSVDIIAHEAGHAVLDSEVRTEFDPTASKTAPQQGALHESFGDVLGVLVEGDYQIGEDTYTPGVAGDAIRDLSRPQRFEDMDQIGSETEPHLLADIPNLAAYRAMEAIGQKDMGQVWYHGFVDRMADFPSFGDAAAATIAAATQLFGKASTQASAVAQAWTSVGVTPSTRLRTGA